jgi:predicted enzyme related to lactoylglutathione lyase
LSTSRRKSRTNFINIISFLKKIESLGGKTVVPTTEIPNMVTFALFKDPEGNMVGLVKG